MQAKAFILQAVPRSIQGTSLHSGSSCWALSKYSMLSASGRYHTYLRLMVLLFYTGKPSIVLCRHIIFCVIIARAVHIGIIIPTHIFHSPLIVIHRVIEQHSQFLPASSLLLLLNWLVSTSGLSMPFIRLQSYRRCSLYCEGLLPTFSGVITPSIHPQMHGTVSCMSA